MPTAESEAIDPMGETLPKLFSVGYPPGVCPASTH